MRTFLTFLLMVMSANCIGQIAISGNFTVPENQIIRSLSLDEEYYVWMSSLLRDRAIFLRDESPASASVDTVIVSDAFKDDYMFDRLRLDTLPKTRFPYQFCHSARFEFIYSLPTSTYWMKANNGLPLYYVDCQAKLIVQDLGIHQAKLVNRLGSAPKNHFVERPVRVLYILEFLELKGACEPLDSLGR